jgi:hypothetical protein
LIHNTIGGMAGSQIETMQSVDSPMRLYRPEQILSMAQYVCDNLDQGFKMGPITAAILKGADALTIHEVSWIEMSNSPMLCSGHAQEIRAYAEHVPQMFPISAARAASQ